MLSRRLTPDEFRAKVRQWNIPPDHVLLPRAEVEALRARCERLRRVAEAGNAYRLAKVGSRRELDLLAEMVAALNRLHGGDLADDLRSLDDLPPLNLAPLPE